MTAGPFLVQSADNGSIQFGVTSLAVTFDAIPVDNEIIILKYTNSHLPGATRTWPSGFTEFIANESGTCGQYEAWKRASGEGSATYTLTVGAGDNNQELLGFDWFGCARSGNPYEALAGSPDHVTTANITVSAITTLTDNAAHVVSVTMSNHDMGTIAATGYTVAREPAANPRHGTLYKLITPAGSTGTVSVTGISGVGDDILGTSYALKWDGISYTSQSNSCTASSDAAAGTVAWTSPTAANTVNSVRATAALSSGSNNSRYLKGLAFGHTVDASGTVLGHIVRSMGVNIGAASAAADTAFRLVKVGTIGTTDRASAVAYATAAKNIVHGSPADLWGTTWTPSDCNDATSGCAMRSLRSGGSPTVGVDGYEWTIFYTIPAAGGLPFFMQQDLLAGGFATKAGGMQ